MTERVNAEGEKTKAAKNTSVLGGKGNTRRAPPPWRDAGVTGQEK
jgi:hypothetical protein